MRKIHLDWQTETEDWEPEPSPEISPESPGRKESWRFLLAVLFFLSAVLLLVGRRVGLQVEQAEENTKEAVLAAHSLLLEAATNRDEELFSTLISSPDTWWINAQLNMVQEGQLTDRDPLGLDQVAPASEADVTFLSPDLTQAEVTYPVDFIVTRLDGFTETVTLQQSMAFIRKDGGWRYTRPDRDTWGEWQTIAQDNIQVSYREIDEDVSVRLASDLITVINDMCLYTGKCPPQTELLIRLEETLNGLPQVSRSIHPGEARISIGLPTPFLVGRPVDEAAYQALRRGYARHILRFLIIHWEAPELQGGMESYYNALLHRRFVDLGLESWPPRGDTGDEAPPYPFPDQNLATICVAEPDQGSELAIYDITADRWPLSLVTKSLSQLDPLPDDSGVLLHSPDSADSRGLRLMLWRPDAPMIELGASLGVTFDRGGQGGTIHILDQGYELASFHVPDFAQCTPAGCQMEVVPYTSAQWSPDGQFQLYLDMESDRYYLRHLASGGERILTSAISAHWADNETVALVRSESPSRTARRITLFDVRSGEQRDLVSYDDILLKTTDVNYSAFESLYVQDVLAWAGRPDSYLVAVYIQNPTSSLFPPTTTRYILGVQTGQDPHIELLATIESQFSAPLELSPDGRWLSLPGYNLETYTSHLSLVNLESGQTERYAFPHDQPYVFGDHDWSLNGNWLVIADKGVLTLIAPGTGYQKHIIHPKAGCAYAAFINK